MGTALERRHAGLVRSLVLPDSLEREGAGRRVPRDRHRSEAGSPDAKVAVVFRAGLAGRWTSLALPGSLSVHSDGRAELG